MAQERNISTAEMFSLLESLKIDEFIIDTTVKPPSLYIAYREDTHKLFSELNPAVISADPREYGAPFHAGKILHSRFAHLGWKLSGNIHNYKPNPELIKDTTD